MDVPVAFISLVDEGRQWFMSKNGVDLCETAREHAICAHAIVGGEPLVILDATQDPRFADNPLVTGPFGLRFYAGAPIVIDGHAVGTLCCVDTVPREPSVRQIEGLAALARQAGVLMAAHRQTRELAQAQRRFAAFLDHAPVGAFMKDAQGRFHFTNALFEGAVGRDAASIVGGTDYDLFPPAAAEGYREADAAVRRNGTPLEFEEDVPLASGGMERWRTLKFPIEIEGEIWVGGVGIDVTALREAEGRVGAQNAELVRREEALTTALQDAETAGLAVQMAAARFEQLFDGLPVACFTYGEGGTIHEWNAAASHLWGISAEEALLAPLVGTAVSEANRMAQEEIDRRVFDGETARGVERRETMRDGRERWLLTSTFPLRTPSGAIVGAVCASLDVTKRKRAEEEMREARMFAEGMADSATSMLYLVNFDTKAQVWSNRDWASTLGYTESELLAPDLLGRIMHPDDLSELPKISGALARAVDREVIEFEARFRHTDGEWRWLWFRESVYRRKPDGSPDLIMGSAQDVTGRKRMEADLRASEARFRTVVESLHEGLTVQNADGKILLWNPSAQRIIGADITGANSQDGLGTEWRLIREDGTAYDPQAMPIPCALRTGEAQESVVVGVETARGTQWLSVNAAPLATGEEGPSKEAVSSFVDITERKRMESALRESETRFRTVVESLSEGLVVHDEERRIVYWNRSAERILGMTAEEMLGLNQMPKSYRFVNEDGSDCAYEDRPATRALRTGQVQEPRTMGVHMPDGTFRWLSAGAVPIEAENGGRTAVSSVVDVTERHAQERRLREYADELKSANARLEDLATTDGLTGLKNHRFFQDWLRRRIEQCASGLPLSIALLDVDRFKLYNDDFGHQAGDAVLRGVAVALQSAVRAGDLIARYGGEEFVVVMPGANATMALATAERLRMAVAALPFPVRAVTASFGVATLGEGMIDAPSIIGAADEALYASKHGGRNRVTHWRELATVLEAV